MFNKATHEKLLLPILNNLISTCPLIPKWLFAPADPRLSLRHIFTNRCYIRYPCDCTHNNTSLSWPLKSHTKVSQAERKLTCGGSSNSGDWLPLDKSILLRQTVNVWKSSREFNVLPRFDSFDKLVTLDVRTGDQRCVGLDHNNNCRAEY